MPVRRAGVVGSNEPHASRLCENRDPCVACGWRVAVGPDLSHVMAKAPRAADQQDVDK
jgi:hypothetical protein